MKTYNVYIDFINKTRLVLASSNAPLGTITSETEENALNEIKESIRDPEKVSLYGFRPVFRFEEI